MLTRAGVARADTVLVPGASGGVGGALVQLAKRRGARVVALASEAKHGDVAALGAGRRLLPRAPEDLRAALGRKDHRGLPMWWADRHGRA
jgi:NADPH:quinone reductase-like Zn-dependent oxidoreductase